MSNRIVDRLIEITACSILLASPVHGANTVADSTKQAPPAVKHTLPEAIKDEMSPAQVRVFGEAPGIHWKSVKGFNPRSSLIVLGKNDDLIAGLYKFAEENQIKGASFTAIGAVGCAALAFYDKDKKAYKVIRVPKQTELVAFSGNIGRKEGKYVVHAHGVLSTEDGQCIGGHFLYASAWPTVEVMLSETEVSVEKALDEETGLSLYSTKIMNCPGD